FFFSSRRRHTRFSRDWSSDVCSSDLGGVEVGALQLAVPPADAGGVDEPPCGAAQLDQLVDRVAGGARHRVDQHPLLTRQAVQQRSEERRVGKEWRSRGPPCREKEQGG